MPASIGWYDSDGSTPLSSLDLGILQPGEDYFTKNGAYRHIVMRNVGDVDLSAVNVEIQQVGNYDAYTKAEIGKGGAPTGFVDYQTGPLALGAMVQGAAANVWINVTETVDAPAAQGKAFNLAASGVV